MGEQADRLLVAFSNEQQMKNKTWRTAMEEWKELASSSTEKTKSNQKCIRVQWAVHTIRQLTNREATVTI